MSNERRYPIQKRTSKGEEHPIKPYAKRKKKEESYHLKKHHRSEEFEERRQERNRAEEPHKQKGTYTEDYRTLFEKFGCFSFRFFITVGIIVIFNSIILTPFLRGIVDTSFLSIAELAMYPIGIWSGWRGWQGKVKISTAWQKFWAFFGITCIACIALGLCG